ncbi:MAG: DUF3098 domain-containing protein [Flavobacteriales bacterium]|jgi:hypothetical protein|nr:DUF3098 domain-containing protein [Flavobacteriales bacterium]
MATSNSAPNAPQFAFERKNYIALLTGLFLIALGFVLMYGAGSTDPNEFSEDIFSFRRITLAPLTVLAGYGVVFFAILKRFPPTDRTEG